MKFFNHYNGIAMGDPTEDCLSIIITNDGGYTWNKIPCEKLPKVADGEAAFAASNTNIKVLGKTVWIATGGTKARVFKSKDFGETWAVFETPIIQGEGPQGIYSIDFADGWNGSGSNWYISGGAKAGIEGSNNGDNGDATPLTSPTLSNITVVGPVSEGALYFKEGGGKFSIENFYASNVTLGVKVKSTDTPANTRIANGDLEISNFQFADAPSEMKKTDYVGDTSWLVEGATSGAGNGAAPPSWTTGWTRGLTAVASTKANIQGEIDTEVTLNSSTEISPSSISRTIF